MLCCHGLTYMVLVGENVSYLSCSNFKIRLYIFPLVHFALLLALDRTSHRRGLQNPLQSSKCATSNCARSHTYGRIKLSLFVWNLMMRSVPRTTIQISSLWMFHCCFRRSHQHLASLYLHIHVLNVLCAQGFG